MDGSIVDSIGLRFDFMLNDHFSTDVNLLHFEYKPYIVNFLFGIFCILKPYNTSLHRYFRHKFHVPNEDDVIRWALVVNRSNVFDLNFVNFYLNDTSTRFDALLLQQEYDALTNESIFASGKFGNISLHEYSIYPLSNKSHTLKLITKKLQPRRLSLGVRGPRTKSYRYMNASEPLYTAAKGIWESPNGASSGSLFKAAERTLRPLNRSLIKGMDTANVSGFVHGILYAGNNSEGQLSIHHHQETGKDSFYITIGTRKWNSFTLAFLSNVSNSNSIRSIRDRDLTCDAYKVMRVFDYKYGSWKPDTCYLGKKSRFYKNGRDYLGNIFNFSQNIVNDKLLKREFGDFVDYLSDVLEQVRPSKVKYGETTINYLKFFFMGSITSSEENDYKASVHIFENIFIFKPKSIESPFIILTLNTGYQRVTLSDLDGINFNASSPIFWVSINESFSTIDGSLSRKLLSREVSIKLIPRHQLADDRKLFPKWIELNRFEILTNLLQYKLDLNNFADLMGNVFKILYNIDYRYSFHPFMHGLFYRSALSKSLRRRELWFLKNMSRWTYTLSVFDQANGWRNLNFYFLPSFEEIVQFVNSVERASSKGTNLYHIFLVYDQKNRKLQTLISRETGMRNSMAYLLRTVCGFYSYNDAHFCKLNVKYQAKKRLRAVRKYFSMPNLLVKHIKLIDKLAGNITKEYMTETQISLDSQWFMTRSQKVHPIKKIHDQYLLGENLKKLSIDVTGVGLNDRDVRNIVDTAAGKMVGLTKFTLTGTIDLPQLVDVVQSHASYMKEVGKPALHAILNALTPKLKENDLTNLLQSLNEVLELLVWERTIERLSIKVSSQESMEFSTNKSDPIDIVSVNKMIWNYPYCPGNISSYTCAEGSICNGIVVELDRQFLRHVKPSKLIDEGPGIHLYCRNLFSLFSSSTAVKGESVSNKTMSYHCDSLSALHIPAKAEYSISQDNCTTQAHNLGPRLSLRKTSNIYPLNFAILHGLSIIEGGDADDIFDFVFSLQCGSISGGHGDDTVKLNQYVSVDYELLIRSNSIKYRLINDTQETDCVFLNSIERIIGQPYRTETVFIDCTFTMVSLNGGQPDYPDVIHVPHDLYCPDVISFVIRGDTVIRNMAQSGRFLYKVSSLVNSSAVIYLEGTEKHIDHTIILEYASVDDITSISHENYTISIFSTDGGSLLLHASDICDSVTLIFKDGEQLSFDGKIVKVELNDVKHNLAALMNKYADMRLFENISLSIESHEFDMNFRIMNHRIQHWSQSPMRFKFHRVQLDGDNTSIECSPGQTYALILNTKESELPRTTVRTFVYRPVSNSSDEAVQITIDLTQLYLTNNSIVSITQVENSTMFLITAVLITNEIDHSLCKLYFDGLDEDYKLKNILILHQSMYQPKVQASTIQYFEDSNKSYSNSSMNNYQNFSLTWTKVPKVYRHLVDNIARFKPDDIDFNEELTFPTIFLINYEMIRIDKHLVLTSIRSNIDEDVRKFDHSLFTFVLEDYFTNEKMKTLALKFGNGIIVRTNEDMMSHNHLYSSSSFQNRLTEIENYLTKRESKKLVYIGDDLSHKWQEILFDRPRLW